MILPFWVDLAVPQRRARSRFGLAKVANPHGNLPVVIDFVGDDFFFVWFDGDFEFDGLGVGFAEVLRFFFDRPI